MAYWESKLDVPTRIRGIRMPIFMDRHDIAGVTAKDVAEAHQKDLKVQDKYSCRVLTYWFDEKKGTTFCLIEAPEKEAVHQLHDNAHGLVPNQIIEVDSRVVKAFLGRIEDPEPADGSGNSGLHIFEDPAFRTILAAELKNSARINSILGIGEGLKLFRSCKELIKKALNRHRGLAVQYTGNGMITSFRSVSRAVDCAVEIQTHIKKYNRQLSGVTMQMGIGLSAGEPVTERKSFFEEAIQFARRLCYVAEGGQVVVSSVISDHYKQETLEMLSDEKTVKILHPTEESFLNRLMDVTEKAWNHREFNVAELGRRMGLSKSQLYRKLTSLTGRTPTDFIREFRLNEAVKLFEKRRGNIAQIAFETGFRNPSYFSKCFRQHFGILPSDYMKTVA